MAKSTKKKRIPKPPVISKRADGMQASPLRKLAATAVQREKKGVKVYKLNIGQPDLPTHPDFMKGVKGFKEKTVAYAPSDGLASAKKAWSSYYKNPVSSSNRKTL